MMVHLSVSFAFVINLSQFLKTSSVVFSFFLPLIFLFYALGNYYVEGSCD